MDPSRHLVYQAASGSSVPLAPGGERITSSTKGHILLPLLPGGESQTQLRLGQCWPKQAVQHATVTAGVTCRLGMPSPHWAGSRWACEEGKK